MKMNKCLSNEAASIYVQTNNINWFFFSVNYDLRYKRNPRALLEFLKENPTVCWFYATVQVWVTYLTRTKYRRQNLKRYFHFCPTSKKFLVHVLCTYCEDQSPYDKVFWWALFRRQILRFELVGASWVF